MKPPLKILQEKIRARHESFWYEGLVAMCGRYQLVACGDIRVQFGDEDKRWCCNEIAVYEAYQRKLTDKTLYNKRNGIGEVDDNNWFEVVGENGEDVLGDVVFTYDEGIAMLKRYYREDTLELYVSGYKR